MTPRQEFKQCLIKGWLTHKVWQCAAMVMIDHGIQHENESGTPDTAMIENFLRNIEVPPYQNMAASTYIAAFYPLTSTALFMNNLTASNILKALHIFWREKQQTADYSKTLAYKHQYEKIRNKQIKFIRARDLSKKHDWNTVK
jgi:hypothetical protein